MRPRGPAPMSTVAGRLWNRLSDSACEILQPFLTSLYSRNDKQPAFAVPIFKAGRPDMTFQEWISDWCCHLISKVGFFRGGDKASRALEVMKNPRCLYTELKNPKTSSMAHLTQNF